LQLRHAEHGAAAAQVSSAQVLPANMRMLLEICRQTLSTLWAHKLRSFLTMFAIAWGVGSLLLLVGLGEGFPLRQQKAV